MTPEHPLDVTELKRRFDECVRLVDGTAVQAQQAQKHEYYRAQTALFEEFINQAPAVLDALEEREGLRARLTRVEDHEDVLMREVARLDAGIRRAEDFCARSTACGAILRAAREAEEVSDG